uniref:Protein kinase domain-containing protein n=1 Tax=Vitis vinifera TaxID=29760 RepID=F6HY60_VITVI
MPSEGGSYVSTAIVGTPGYIDPEYDKTSVPSKKTDIYSFGIVLLELISGRPAIIKITKESPCNIADWVHLVTAKGDIKMIVDPRLQGEFDPNSAQRAVETAMYCVPVSSIDRPTMNIVVKPNEDDKTFEPKNQHLTYFEVERITDNFQKELGRGASSIVYHGHLSNGTEVAVKKLSPSSILGSKQFKTEAQLLTRVHHKNLVSLFGYCDEGSNMVLIYEYMAKGNVKAYLSGKTEAVLSWEQRLQIAIDAAQALEYLHNGCNPPIIHRDIKTENILLNEKLQAKVADFGWSKSMPAEGGSYVLTAIVGTPGYLDPEYHRSSVPNEKTDVYSFGIVLLELISGRPAIIKITKENLCNITNWVHHIIAKGDIRMIVDPRLQGEFETNSARRTIETAMSCVSFSSTERPTMSDIVVELRECLKIAMAHERTNNLEEDHDSAGIEAAMTAEER